MGNHASRGTTSVAMREVDHDPNVPGAQSSTYNNTTHSSHTTLWAIPLS